ncbi:MAG: hypothetical protein ACI8VW_002878, partial [bacterium]
KMTALHDCKVIAVRSNPSSEKGEMGTLFTRFRREP